MLNVIIILKRPYISLIIATRGSKCENNLKEVKAWDSFPIVKWGYLTTKALHLL